MVVGEGGDWMRVGRVVAGVVLMGLVVAGCGSGGDEGVAVSSPVAVAGSEVESAPWQMFVPARVTVCRPGFVDTGLVAEDLPVWPGPDPAEFLELTPTGECGDLEDEQGTDVYVAAFDNPDALWNVGGTVEWLVVDQLP